MFELSKRYRHGLIVGAVAAFTLCAIAVYSNAGQLQPPPGPVQPTGPTPITSLPYTITQSGSYILTGNLIGSSGQDGVIIQSSNVTIDLNGFTLQGVAGARSGITVPVGGFGLTEYTGVVIKNGSIVGWPAAGIQLSKSDPFFSDEIKVSHSRIESIYVFGPSSRGIENGLGRGNVYLVCNVTNISDNGLWTGPEAIVDRCTVTSCLNGIVAGNSLVTRCVVSSCTLIGISNGLGTTECSYSSSNGSYGFSVGMGLLRGCTAKWNSIAAVQSTGTTVLIDNNF